jgi:peptidoglycan/LPS O-acetylase OafA/YrhL
MITHQTEQINPLTGIRGVAALWVISLHFNGFSDLFHPMNYLKPLWKSGGLGVDLFFILSGFILCYVYSAGSRKLSLKDYGHFLWFRIARLYPNQIATLILLEACVIFGGIFKVQISGNYPFSSLLYQLTMTQAWPFVPGNDGSQWNYPSWSISAEWFAYLIAFPLTSIILSKRITFQKLAFAIFFLLGVYLALNNIKPLRAFMPLIQVTLEFLAGGLTYECYLMMSEVVRDQIWRSLDWVVLMGIVFLLMASEYVSKCFILIIPLILLGLTSRKSRTAKLLSIPIMIWLGEISYSLYMTHAITQKLLKPLLPIIKYAEASLISRACVLIIYLVSIFSAASILYYLVEIPCRNWMRVFFRNHKTSNA